MLKLETFEVIGGAAPVPDGGRPSEQAAIEESRLSGYDQGYQAGWDDAAAAQIDEKNRISADLARNLQGLAFTWQEARSHVLQALEPLLETMISRLLPEIARESLAPLILETLMPLAEAHADTPATLQINPRVRRRVEAILEQAPGLVLQLQDEPSLAEGQVYIRMGPAETKIDLTRATAQIATAVRAFFTLEQESQDNGRAD